MKYLFISILALATMNAYGQALSSNQAEINGTIFSLGINSYEKDYDLIFNKWYQGHSSAKDLKRGESLDWVNNFTKKYSISISDYDVSLNHIDIGNSFHTIKFNDDSSSYIYLFYDNSGKLVSASIESAWDDVKIFSGIKIPREWSILDLGKGIIVYATDYYQFSGNAIFELIYHRTSELTLGVTQINVGLVDKTSQTKFKDIVQWTTDYEKKTGESPAYDDASEKLVGFVYTDSSIRITREQDEKERTARVEQARLEQVRREEDERVAQEQREKERIARAEQARLEQVRREEDKRVAQEQREKERIARAEQANLKKMRQAEEVRVALEWYQSLQKMTIKKLVINDESNTIIVGITKKTDAEKILQSACSNHRGWRMNNNCLVSPSGGKQIFISFKGNKVESIRVLAPAQSRSPAGEDFIGSMYGILDIIPDGIKLW
jgi:hypothetical protein